MITYRKAEEKDIKTIAKLHVELFPEYFLTSFGENLVCEYYTEFFKEQNLFIVAVDNNEIIGFVMGYLTGSTAKRNFEKKHASTLMRKLIFRCLKFDKQAIKKCVARVKAMLKRNKNAAKDTVIPQ